MQKMQSSTSSLEQRLMHMNVPQQKAYIIGAKINAIIAGRGTGKTVGVMCPQSIRNAQDFPRGAEAFVNTTFVKIGGDLKAAWTDGMERWGFFEGVDFWWGRPIPKNIEHEKPFQAGDPKFQVAFTNGHVKRLIGIDRSKTAGPALSNDFISVDEAKYLNYPAFKSRILPTNRGNEDIFSHIPHHHGLTYLTDMPTSPEGQWLFDFENLCDEELLGLIVSYQFEYNEVNDEYEKLKETFKTIKEKNQLHEQLEVRLRKRLAQLKKILDDLRRECVFFMETSTLDNIDVLQPGYIEQMRLSMTDFEFQTSILGKRIFAVENQFYPKFNVERHTDDQTINYRYIDLIPDLTKGIPSPWRKDLDLDHTLPLYVSCDWGARISCATISQKQTDYCRFLNEFFVKGGGSLKELAKLITDYYEGSPIEDIVFLYDHTANHTDASREKTYADEFAGYLRGYGWKVRMVYIGQASAHDLRFKMWKRVMSGEANDVPIMINTHNCKNLITSIQMAGAIESRSMTFKDKRNERNNSFKQEHATHFTDAFDTAYVGSYGAIKVDEEMDYGLVM